ncbi:hypothetical protein FRC07_005270 [Ceratobasidium sp. 392]|nr:hypothetical protein FRC07_005270 [Ceratobasidium sp. 392]
MVQKSVHDAPSSAGTAQPLTPIIAAAPTGRAAFISASEQRSVLDFDPMGTSTPADIRRVRFGSLRRLGRPEHPTSEDSAPENLTDGAVPSGSPARRTRETAEERGTSVLHDFANLGRAISTPLELVVRAVSQTPCHGQAKHKIPAPEQYSGNKGNTGKALLIKCRTYFVSNPSCLLSDNARIMYVLMNLKKELFKQWGQCYFNKLLAG